MTRPVLPEVLAPYSDFAAAGELPQEVAGYSRQKALLLGERAILLLLLEEHGTLAVNVSGSFLVGLLMVLLTERWQPHPYWRLFLVVGVLGGYTTFSTFEYETYQAMRDGERWMGLFYVMGSVVAGYLAVWLGALAAARR